MWWWLSPVNSCLSFSIWLKCRLPCRCPGHVSLWHKLLAPWSSSHGSRALRSRVIFRQVNNMLLITSYLCFRKAAQGPDPFILCPTSPPPPGHWQFSAKVRCASLVGSTLGLGGWEERSLWAQPPWHLPRPEQACPEQPASLLRPLCSGWPTACPSPWFLLLAFFTWVSDSFANEHVRGLWATRGAFSSIALGLKSHPWAVFVDKSVPSWPAADFPWLSPEMWRAVTSPCPGGVLTCLAQWTHFPWLYHR